MSYDISLCDPVTKKTLEIKTPHFMTGGTYKVGGNTELWLNITYNYADYYYQVYPEGIRTIYGKTGAESIEILNHMISEIKKKYMTEDGEWIYAPHEFHFWRNIKTKEVTDSLYNVLKRNDTSSEDWESYEELRTISEGPCDDYWQDTAGNALKPLYSLLAMAQMRPDGVWEGD